MNTVYVNFIDGRLSGHKHHTHVLFRLRRRRRTTAFSS